MNHQTYVVLGISGSLRKDSSNTRLLSFIKRMMPAGTEFRMYQGLATLPHFSPDLDGDEAEPHEAVREWRKSCSGGCDSESVRQNMREVCQVLSRTHWTGLYLQVNS